MSVISGDMVFYGVNNISKKLDGIVKNLNLKDQSFEVKLIMSEAISNAYIHGNNSDNSKPIYVQWELIDNFVRITVKDSGQGVKDLNINKEINQDGILEESGRGLFIINNYTDEVKFDGSSIIMGKYLV